MRNPLAVLYLMSLCAFFSEHKWSWWEFLTHRVSCLPDGNLAGKDIEVFPRLTVIPELKKKKNQQTKRKARKGKSQLAILSGCSFPCGLQIEQTKKHARVPTASLVIPFINSRDGPKGQIPSYQHLAASLRK